MKNQVGLLEFLMKNSAHGLPLHVPGHKRNLELLPEGLPWDIDVTEVEPFDNLHSPDGVLKEGQDYAAELFGSQKTYYLVGGSTAGILAGIRAATKRGDRVLVARNCHQSVYHAIELCGLKAVFLNPEPAEPYSILGSIAPDDVKTALKAHGDISLVIITSPTYEGVISDIESIAKAAHERDAALLVDEAHGAHLYFGVEQLGALNCGADIVVHSLHKMLPSLTQTGLVHLNSNRVSENELAHQLSVFQSSSPSYPLMASIDSCCRLMKERGRELYELNLTANSLFRGQTKNLSVLTLADFENNGRVFAYDRFKLVIYTGYSDKDGLMLGEILRERYDIKLELSCAEYMLAVNTLCDRQDSLQKLLEVLADIDSGLHKVSPRPKPYLPMEIQKDNTELDIERAMGCEQELCSIEKSEGKVAGEYLWIYPPGIPVVIPGQLMSGETINWIKTCNEDILTSHGLYRGEIFVCK